MLFSPPARVAAAGAYGFHILVDAADTWELAGDWVKESNSAFFCFVSPVVVVLKDLRVFKASCQVHLQRAAEAPESGVGGEGRRWNQNEQQEGLLHGEKQGEASSGEQAWEEDWEGDSSHLDFHL